MKKFLMALFAFLVCCGVIIGSVGSGAAETSGSSIVTGGTFTCYGRPLPRNIGYQPTMTETDRVGIVQAMVETLMNMNSDGELVPELAMSVDTDPAAKTITWHLRQGVQFHDGTPFNAEAAAWNFQQMKDAGTLQFGEQIVNISTPDDFELVIELKNFSYLFVQAFSFNTYMYSPTAIQKNGKNWAITNGYGTGPFMLESLVQNDKVVVVKNPNYWKPGRPYLDAIVAVPSTDSAVNYAAMKSNEIQMYWGGDRNMQKKLVSEGCQSVLFTAYPTVEFLVPSTGDPNSPLTNPLVREAIEYAVDRNAICQGVWQGNAEPMDQMAYKGAVGYDPGIGRLYDPARAGQLLEKAGYPGGKGLDMTVYCPVPPNVTRVCTAVVGYLQKAGINAKLTRQTFPLHNSKQVDGWENGYFYLRDPGVTNWTMTYLSWFGPQPTFNPVGGLKRPDVYNKLAFQVLNAPDKETYHGIVRKLIRMAQENSLVLAMDFQPSTWVIQPYAHYEADMTQRSTFDWGALWMEKQ